MDHEDGDGQYPLCETDYFRRLDLLCFECGGALRGSYITALERKYHIEHFTCSVCPTVFGAQDSYYEHEGKVYCHYHYSTQFAQRCNGCQTAILKQFVEIFRNGRNQHWHPECYMIHKFWNVRLAPSGTDGTEREQLDTDATDEERTRVREDEEKMEEKVYRIWSVLSTFEESSAACISDMLLHVSNGAYIDGVLVAKKFIWHVDILFSATDRLHHLIMSEGMKGNNSCFLSVYSPLGANVGFRAVLRKGSEAIVQKDSCFLLFAVKNPRNRCQKVGCYPRATFARYRSCPLSKAINPDQLTGSVETRARAEQHRRATPISR